MSEHETAGQEPETETKATDAEDKLPGTVRDLSGLRQQKVQARISRLQEDLTALEADLTHRQSALSAIVDPEEVRIRDERTACATLDESRRRLDMEDALLAAVITDHTARIAECRELQAIALRAREAADAAKAETIRLAASAHQKVSEARNRHAKNTAGLLKEIERAKRRLATAMSYNPTVS